MDDFGFLRASSAVAAPQLLGCILERELDGKLLRVRIVEVEAYDQSDMASHSYHGRTPSNSVMFGPHGFLYVYFTYGMHYCMNIVTDQDGRGAGVLIRAVEPVQGIEIIRQNRGNRPDKILTNGPGKITQALKIDRAFSGHNLRESPFRLIAQPALSQSDIVQTTRIGIAKAKDVPWRFYIKDNLNVSKKG